MPPVQGRRMPPRQGQACVSLTAPRMVPPGASDATPMSVRWRIARGTERLANRRSRAGRWPRAKVRATPWCQGRPGRCRSARRRCGLPLRSLRVSTSRTPGAGEGNGAGLCRAPPVGLPQGGHAWACRNAWGWPPRHLLTESRGRSPAFPSSAGIPSPASTRHRPPGASRCRWPRGARTLPPRPARRVSASASGCRRRRA